MTNPNDPAFIDAMGEGFKMGFTKREYFAAMAMQGKLAHGPLEGEDATMPAVMAHCILLADALIAELNKEKSA